MCHSDRCLLGFVDCCLSRCSSLNLLGSRFSIAHIDDDHDSVRFRVLVLFYDSFVFLKLVVSFRPLFVHLLQVPLLSLLVHFQMTDEKTMETSDFGYEPEFASSRVTDAEINDMLRQFTSLDFICQEFDLLEVCMNFCV